MVKGPLRTVQPDLVLAIAQAWADGRIVPEIPLNVGRNHVAVDTFTGNEPLARDVRHVG